MKYFIYLFLFSCFFSCAKKQEVKDKNLHVKPLLSVVKEHLNVEEVKPTYRKEIEDWQELKSVNNFISRFKKVSPNEVLSNALELKGLVKSLRDSVKPILFNTASFTTRVNILYNETLRLADMTFIPSIKAAEVNNQTDKILDAFSAVNAKVNTILSKKHFEDLIEVDVSFIGLDSTKIDTVSKRAIKNNFLESDLNRKDSKLKASKRKEINLP